MNLEDPTKAKYVFANWTDEEKNKILEDKTFIMGMENRTLKANWKTAQQETQKPTPPTNQAPGTLPQTGEGIVVSISIIMIAIIGIFVFKKYKKIDS